MLDSHQFLHSFFTMPPFTLASTQLPEQFFKNPNSISLFKSLPRFHMVHNKVQLNFLRAVYKVPCALTPADLPTLGRRAIAMTLVSLRFGLEI